MLLGKLTFLMIDALPKKTMGERFTELENHCQGKKSGDKKEGIVFHLYSHNNLEGYKEYQGKGKRMCN